MFGSIVTSGPLAFVHPSSLHFYRPYMLEKKLHVERHRVFVFSHVHLLSYFRVYVFWVAFYSFSFAVFAVVRKAFTFSLLL